MLILTQSEISSQRCRIFSLDERVNEVKVQPLLHFSWLEIILLSCFLDLSQTLFGFFCLQERLLLRNRIWAIRLFNSSQEFLEDIKGGILGNLLLGFVVYPWIIVWSSVDINLFTDVGNEVSNRLQILNFVPKVGWWFRSWPEFRKSSKWVLELYNLDPRYNHREHLI